jgi:heme O synthase-like polyprenyltransferase
MQQRPRQRKSIWKIKIVLSMFTTALIGLLLLPIFLLSFLIFLITTLIAMLSLKSSGVLRARFQRVDAPHSRQHQTIEGEYRVIRPRDHHPVKNTSYPS